MAKAVQQTKAPASAEAEPDPLAEHARAIVAACKTMAASIKAAHADMAADGGDGTKIAGLLIREVRKAGGRLPENNPHRFRWPFERPRVHADPHGYAGAVALATEVCAALLKGPGPDPNADDAAAVWPNHACQGPAKDALDAVTAERVDAKRRADIKIAAAALAARNEAERKGTIPRPAPVPMRAPPPLVLPDDYEMTVG
jgi:hypothetical protein